MKKIYVSFEDIQRQVQDILRQMHNDNWRPDYIVGLTRGGLTPAVLLSQYLDIPCETLRVSLREHGQTESNCWMAEDAFGTVPFQEVESYGARWDPARRKKILIVDDINDSGATINWIVDDWQSSCMPNEPSWNTVWGHNVRFGTLYDNLASDAKLSPTYTSEEINKAEDPSWVVFPWEEWWRRWNPTETYKGKN